MQLSRAWVKERWKNVGWKFLFCSACKSKFYNAIRASSSWLTIKAQMPLFFQDHKCHNYVKSLAGNHRFSTNALVYFRAPHWGPWSTKPCVVGELPGIIAGLISLFFFQKRKGILNMEEKNVAPFLLFPKFLPIPLVIFHLC